GDARARAARAGRTGPPRRCLSLHLPPLRLRPHAAARRDGDDGRRAGDPQRTGADGGRPHRGRGRHRGRARQRHRGGRHRQVDHAGRHRHPLAPGRVRQPRRARALGRQRGHAAQHRRGVGRALGVAAGPRLRAGAGGRGHHHADPPRLRQPVRRAQRDAQERAVAHGAGDEVSRRAVRDEDGVRREPQAGVRQPRRPGHAHGQHGRLPRRLDPRRRVPPQDRRGAAHDRWCGAAGLGLRRRRGGGAAGLGARRAGRRHHARPGAGNAGRRAARRDPGAQPLLPGRRDGADDRPGARVRLLHPLVPPRGGGVQGARPHGPRQHQRLAVGGLVGVQDGGARLHPCQRRAGAQRRRPRRRTLGRPHGDPEAQPGGRQGHPGGARGGCERVGERRAPLVHGQRRVGAGRARPRGYAGAGQGRGRGGVVAQPVQRVRARGPGVHRRRADVRPRQPRPAAAHGLRGRAVPGGGSAM
ncbi:MAG: FIG01095481: hypothetical protein, partial [uncultured Gemmatimonadetes bacterium]